MAARWLSLTGSPTVLGQPYNEFREEIAEFSRCRWWTRAPCRRWERRPSAGDAAPGPSPTSGIGNRSRCRPAPGSPQGAVWPVVSLRAACRSPRRPKSVSVISPRQPRLRDRRSSCCSCCGRRVMIAAATPPRPMLHLSTGCGGRHRPPGGPGAAASRGATSGLGDCPAPRPRPKGARRVSIRGSSTARCGHAPRARQGEHRSAHGTGRG